LLGVVRYWSCDRHLSPQCRGMTPVWSRDIARQLLDGFARVTPAGGLDSYMLRRLNLGERQMTRSGARLYSRLARGERHVPGDQEKPQQIWTCRSSVSAGHRFFARVRPIEGLHPYRVLSP
jgi:hypothetical protein